MSLFDWLLLGHLFGDFIVQTDAMARNKPQQWRWLMAHLLLYTACLAVVIIGHALRYGVAAWLAAAAIVFIFVTHLILDRRSFTTRWMRLVGMSTDQKWLVIVVDQIFHLFTLAIVAQVLS